MSKDYKKLYENALENLKWIKKANRNNNELVDFIEYKYPELQENEDEKIRKWLKDMVELVRKANPDNADHTEMCSEALDWLKKQGEQKTQSKQEWSEEDETKLRTAQTFIRNTSLIEVEGIKEATIDWLKSLKERMKK